MNAIVRELAPAEPMQPVCDPAGWYSPEVISYGGGDVTFGEAEARGLVDAAAAGSSDLGPGAMRAGRIVSELRDGLGFALVTGVPDAAEPVLEKLLELPGVEWVRASAPRAGTIASLPTVYNEMLARRPYLLAAALSAGVLFSVADGALRGAPRPDSAEPGLAGALELYDALLVELAHPLTLESGDVLAWNARVVHARIG